MCPDHRHAWKDTVKGMVVSTRGHGDRGDEIKAIEMQTGSLVTSREDPADLLYLAAVFRETARKIESMIESENNNKAVTGPGLELYDRKSPGSPARKRGRGGTRESSALPPPKKASGGAEAKLHLALARRQAVSAIAITKAESAISAAREAQRQATAAAREAQWQATTTATEVALAKWRAARTIAEAVTENEEK